ncbi:hypothetical protein ACWDKQ_22985, partial [Saccharopolyspora sp. NPDC000995]
TSDDLPVLGDLGYEGESGTITVAFKKPKGGEPATAHQTPLDSYTLRLLTKQDGRLPDLPGTDPDRRPTAAVPPRMGTVVAARRPTGDQRQLPHPPRTAQLTRR